MLYKTKRKNHNIVQEKRKDVIWEEKKNRRKKLKSVPAEARTLDLRIAIEFVTRNFLQFVSANCLKKKNNNNKNHKMPKKAIGKIQLQQPKHRRFSSTCLRYHGNTTSRTELKLKSQICFCIELVPTVDVAIHSKKLFYENTEYFI